MTIDWARLDALVDDVGAGRPAMVTRCLGPYAAFLHKGFAGACTDWRGVGLDDGATYEVIAKMHSDVVPKDAVLVADERGDSMIFVPSAAGVTVGDILDESAAQKAKIDVAVAVALFSSIVEPAFLAPEQALSSDHVLVGFDGSVRLRGHLPWWGARKPPSVAPGYVVASVEGEAMLLLGQVLAELVHSRRGMPPSFSLAGVDRRVRRDARDLLVRLREGPVATDLDELWEYGDVPTAKEIRERTDRMKRNVEAVDAAALGALARNLFPERWAREQRARDVVDALVAGYDGGNDGGNASGNASGNDGGAA